MVQSNNLQTRRFHKMKVIYAGIKHSHAYFYWNIWKVYPRISELSCSVRKRKLHQSVMKN